MQKKITKLNEKYSILKKTQGSLTISENQGKSGRNLQLGQGKSGKSCLEKSGKVREFRKNMSVGTLKKLLLQVSECCSCNPTWIVPLN